MNTPTLKSKKTPPLHPSPSRGGVGEGLFYLFILFLLISIACTHVKKDYWPGGVLKSEIHYKNDSYDGPAIWYYENGAKQLESFYKNNLLDGKMIRYYENGQKEEEQVYANGKMNGKRITWDISGNKTGEISYLSGIPDGPYMEWYPGGNLKVEGANSGGKYNGRWYFYDENGNIIGQSDFVNGNGIQKAFYPDGKVKRLTPFRNNLKDGNDIYYREDGKIEKTMVYQNGVLVTSK